MPFTKKTWKDRQSEYPGRRKLSETATAGVYDVSRDEGLVIEEGDALNAQNLNDLESRVETGFDGVAADTSLTGYAKPAASGPIGAADSLNAAIGKLETGVEEAKAALPAPEKLVYPLTHAKSGRVHTLGGLPAGVSRFTAKFDAAADVEDGDSWQVGAVAYTAVLASGEPLSGGMIAAGAIGVQVEVDTTGHKLGFKAGGGQLTKLNVFAKLESPETYDGLWLQTADQFKTIVLDKNVYTSGQFAAPEITTTGVSTSAISTLQFPDRTGIAGSYLYNYVTKQEEKSPAAFPGFPSFLSRARCSDSMKMYYAVGKAIGYYDIAAKTITILKTGTSVGYYYSAECAGIKNRFYIFSPQGESDEGYSSFQNVSYVYDEISAVLSTISNPPTPASKPSIYYDGEKYLYIAGGNSSPGGISHHSTDAFRRYDIQAGTYTTLPNLPYPCESQAGCFVSGKLYLFGGTSSRAGTTKNYYGRTIVFDSQENTWSEISGLGAIYGACGVYVDSGKIHIMHPNNDFILSMQAKEYNPDTLVIDPTAKYHTQLISDKRMSGEPLLSSLSNAWIYKENDLQEYPLYYGDGAQWIKIKN